MIPYIFSLANIKAKPLKNWIWRNVIDTQLGWRDDIQCVIDDIDIEQLMSDKAEEYSISKQEAMDL